jgi:membrane protein
LAPSVRRFLIQAWSQLTAARHPTLLSVGALGFLWGMSGAFRQLIDAINHAYEFPLPRRRPQWKTYALSLLAGLGVGLGVATAISMVVVGPALLHAILGLVFRASLPMAAVAAIRWSVLVVLLWLALSVSYAILPDRPLPVRLLNPGTLVALCLWPASSVAFSFYVDHFNSYERIYGGLGGIILLMLYLYFAGLAIVIGAEINALCYLDSSNPLTGQDGKGGAAPPSPSPRSRLRWRR